MKDILTTGDAARISGLSPSKIIRCFDAGLLKGFRVPGSRFRRTTRDDLLEFMRAHGMPIDPADEPFGDRESPPGHSPSAE